MIFRLAIADLLHERTVFACFVIALAAVLGPLLVLYGLKTGIVDGLTKQLLDDPRNREVIVIGNHSHEEAWLATLAARPEVGFLVPRTRSIAATLYFQRATGGSGGEPGDEPGEPILAELVPTAPGDPLLDPDAVALQDDEVAVSAALADQLRVGIGDRVRGSAIRQVGASRERVALDFTIAQVRPSTLVQRKVAFATLPVLQAIEDYRDGRAVPAFGWSGEERAENGRVYAGLRLYARTLDDVAPLAADLAVQGLDVRSRVAEIEQVRRLDRNLGTLFTILAGLGGAGYLLSFGAHLWAGVSRKRRDISVLRLIGVPAGGLIRFPVWQAAITAIGGMALALVVYGTTAAVINRIFANPALAGEPICRLLPVHYALAAAATLVAALVASAAAAWQIGRIDPADGVRDV